MLQESRKGNGEGGGGFGGGVGGRLSGQLAHPEREGEGGLGGGGLVRWCLHCTTQLLSQSQTRKNLFERMLSFLIQFEKHKGRV